MTEQTPAPLSSEKKALFLRVIYLVGSVFIIGGVFLAFNPAAGAALQFEPDMTRFLGFALVVVGISDCVIARFILRKK